MLADVFTAANDVCVRQKMIIESDGRINTCVLENASHFLT